MHMFFKFGAVLALSCAVFGIASAGEGKDNVTETRQIDARVVRVKIDGVVDLKLRRGDTPSLVITGDRRWIEKTTTTQTGDTLNIDTETHGVKMSHMGLHAELTLPNLREVVSDGLGATDVSGFSGDEIYLSLEGAGAMKVNCNYKSVSVSLGGVGSMNVQGINSDGVELNLRGAGYVTLGGHTKWLKANLGGLGGLDAQWFYADTVNLDLSGLGNAKVSAKQSATLNLSGMGSVTVYGKPANRNVTVDGLGSVSWK